MVKKRGEDGGGGGGGGGGGAGLDDGGTSPSTGRRIRWRKSLSVPDISQISNPVVVFEQEF